MTLPLRSWCTDSEGNHPKDASVQRQDYIQGLVLILSGDEVFFFVFLLGVR